MIKLCWFAPVYWSKKRNHLTLYTINSFDFIFSKKPLVFFRNLCKILEWHQWKSFWLRKYVFHSLFSFLFEIYSFVFISGHVTCGNFSFHLENLCKRLKNETKSREMWQIFIKLKYFTCYQQSFHHSIILSIQILILINNIYSILFIK